MMEFAQTMKRFSRAVFLYVALLSLAACSAGTGRQKVVTAPPPQLVSVDGQWVDGDGISTSSFRNGIFETRSSDTFEKLSEGNYVMRANNLVEIEMRSLVRGTVSRVNCAINNASQAAPQLMCTSQEGTRFTLHRQNGTSPSAVQASL